MNNSPLNIFKSLHLLERYYQNSKAVLAVTGMNWLNYKIQINIKGTYRG